MDNNFFGNPFGGGKGGKPDMTERALDFMRFEKLSVKNDPLAKSADEDDGLPEEDADEDENGEFDDLDFSVDESDGAEA